MHGVGWGGALLTGWVASGMTCAHHCLEGAPQPAKISFQPSVLTMRSMSYVLSEQHFFNIGWALFSSVSADQS